MCLKESFYLMEKLMFHSAFKKDTDKVVLGLEVRLRLEVKGLIKIIEKFRAEKTLCTFLFPIFGKNFPQSHLINI